MRQRPFSGKLVQLESPDVGRVPPILIKLIDDSEEDDDESISKRVKTCEDQQDAANTPINEFEEIRIPTEDGGKVILCIFSNCQKIKIIIYSNFFLMLQAS